MLSPCLFLLTPLREGRQIAREYDEHRNVFLLTPLREGRPDKVRFAISSVVKFLLTPLREGRPATEDIRQIREAYFYSRPCGRGDGWDVSRIAKPVEFLLTPLREGRPSKVLQHHDLTKFLLTPLREGRHDFFRDKTTGETISTHAPAGGATGVALALLDLRVFLLTPLREGRQ